jgi:GNAT superfamily N-acetyltransferase
MELLRIRARPYAHPDAAALVAALFAEQHAIYGHADPVAANHGEYAPPRGLFVVAYGLAEDPVGCGGYRPCESAGTVEVKKMYIRPGWRGLGAGRQILLALERHAAACGARRVVVETGVRNTAAIALYVNAGYRPMRPYISGRDPRINRAFSKNLQPRP